MEDPTIQKQRRLLIFASLGFVGLIAIIVIVNLIAGFISDRHNTLAIEGLTTCAESLSHSDEVKIQKLYYDYVDAQLAIDGRDHNSSRYPAVVRDGSCRVTEFKDAKNHSGYSVEFILDVAELGYSLQAKFDYVKSGDPVLDDIDLGSARLYCLPAADLIYGEFACAKNPLITAVTNGAVELTDIRNLLPYADPSQHYTLQLVASSETKSGYTIVITYYPGNYLATDVDEFRTTHRAEIEQYLTSHGQDLSNYDFFEKWK